MFDSLGKFRAELLESTCSDFWSLGRRSLYARRGTIEIFSWAALEAVSELCTGQFNIASILPRCGGSSYPLTRRLLATGYLWPWLRWLLQVSLFLVSDNSQTGRQFTICHDVETAFDLLLRMFVWLPPKRHLFKSLDFSLAFLGSKIVRYVPDLVTFLFVIVA